ncbi:MAG: DNA-directed RNA polymerase subunit beta [Rikenellaceae bacterium]
MSATKQQQRVSFSTIKNPVPYPDLLEVQLKSFRDFFQMDTTADDRKSEGLYRVFQENFPITDTRNNFVLEFIDYYIDPPRYSIDECVERGLSYSVPLKAKLKLYCTDDDHEDFGVVVQDVYFGTIPYMTERGTFVINGAERVIVSQLHRSPGVFFGQSMHTNGTKLHSARIIPFKGSWIEFATDINNVMYAYIDRKKKLPVTTLLRAIGFETDQQILEIFDLADEVKVNKANLKKAVGRKLAARVLQTWIEDFVDEDTGEVVSIERNNVIVDRETVLEKEHIDDIIESGTKTILLHKESLTGVDFSIIYNTLQKDTCNSEKEAVVYIYRQLRASEPPDEATARDVIDKLFFSDKRYDLGEVGRYRINKKLELDTDPMTRTLTREDIIAIIKYLIQLINAKAEVDDIDHLSNRRVRTVGEQLSNQFSVGFVRMARTIRERMNVRDNEVFTPVDLINAKTLSSVINSFFGTSQLSQFMDQINPLAEITHKRRLSALGPGGLSRDRAGFEVRDVHYTHYGRLCPIESPEGPNIGLISSLCVFAKISPMGFIETPYRAVENGQVDLENSHIKYYSAEEEEGKIVAQAFMPVDESGNFLQPERIKARGGADVPVVNSSELHLMDVAPNQIASIAASLIPFLEHDDANRALMGSNMMRQAVPLVTTEAPIVGTGIEKDLVRDSRIQVVAEKDGEVIFSDATRIEIKYERTAEEILCSFDPEITTYNLPRYRRTNQNTSVTLKPIVLTGEMVKKGQILTEGYSTQGGELALGRNLKVAYMPWKGYNFEDAIVISERIQRDDIFTSVHVDEYIMEVRDTKRGVEELTSDIPNVSEEATRDLDTNGIVRIGANIHPGDILIGKITPKGESDPSPEEKLLRAIFGDKAGDVKDASLKAQPSLHGVVIDTRLYARASKDIKRTKSVEKAMLEKMDEKFAGEVAALTKRLIDKLCDLLSGMTSQSVTDYFGVELYPVGTKFTASMFDAISKLVCDDKSNVEMGFLNLGSCHWTAQPEIDSQIEKIVNNYTLEWKSADAAIKREKYNMLNGDELPQNGVIQLAKVYIAKKRKLKVGDKMAGRHGNKGIVAKIVRDEDMPFLEDGSIVDICLNPLGVPSRMNLGQIFESVLGWAGKELGCKFATPIFDGASLDDINELGAKAGIPHSGRTFLYDGGTGEMFDQPATVGVTYMLKLGHMIDDKMHARSIGPYSLITQQPLGGKAQFGGQRFGEMEVWALEGFGAANILQEILTIKSDDVMGRAKAYEAIVKGDTLPKPGIPEAMNVLLHELRGLALSVKLE